MALPIKVLFVCIHNAGRSQIAAALANYLHAGVLDARSAGLNPDTYVSAVAAKVLAARGLDITGNVPRMLENADLDDADIVITLVRDVEIEVPARRPAESIVRTASSSW